MKPGWQERVHYFESLLRDSKFVATVSNLPLENLRDIREEGSLNQPTPIIPQAVPSLSRDRSHSLRTETMLRLAKVGGHCGVFVWCDVMLIVVMFTSCFVSI